MNWTLDQKLEFLLGLRWSVRVEDTPEGERLLRIVEIPSAVGSGEDIESDLWESLRESLRAYLHFGDDIPLPQNARLPWLDEDAAQRNRPVVIRFRRQEPIGEDTPEADATLASADWEVASA